MESQGQVVKKKETRGRKPKPKADKKDEAGKAKEAKKAQQQQPTIDDKYTQWKSLIPVLYDWLANHNLVWPSISCRYEFLGFSFL
jgi:histone-binding protein RBBP4